MINRTLAQRLNELELNENKLAQGKDIKKQELLNEWVAFAHDEKRKGNPTFWETFRNWDTATDKAKLASYKAMAKFNPLWAKEYEAL